MGLPVILLHGVVPFIEVTEEAHAALDLALLCWRLRLNGGRAAPPPR